MDKWKLSWEREKEDQKANGKNYKIVNSNQQHA